MNLIGLLLIGYVLDIGNTKLIIDGIESCQCILISEHANNFLQMVMTIYYATGWNKIY